MKISYNWLQRHIEEKLPSPNELKETIIFHAFEVESLENINSDTIFDIKVLPDRAHDCLSHRGIAREVCGLLGLNLKTNIYEKLPDKNLATKIEIQSDKTIRYMAVEMLGIKVGPSVDWVVNILSSLGMRSINNIVDATNIVLLDSGQPVHAYDADKIDGGIVVRLAHEGEQITTLSDEVKDFKQEDLVISDYLGPLAIAGIKGGRSAEITKDTNRIIIEVANFDYTSIRKTSKRLSLQTDASKRFENEISPEMVTTAMEQIVSLIKELAGGEVSGLYDYYPKKPQTRSISFSLKDINRLLGPTITDIDIEKMLNSYKYSFSKDGSSYILNIPSERLDIVGAHDIAEEVGRYIGYDRIPIAELPKFGVPVSPEYQNIINTKLWLAQNGFKEVMNYSFVKKGDVYIVHGSKDKSALRSNLSDGLKESYEKNRLNAGLLGLDSIRIFEIGTIFLKDKSTSAESSVGTKEEMRVATCDKGIFEELPLQTFIEKYKIDTSTSLNFPACADRSLSTFDSFKPWSLYPFMTRDIAVWMNNKEDQAKLEEIVSAFADMYCVREPVLFDHFEKEGRTSVAYRLVFQSYEKTLTEAEVEIWSAELVEKIKKDKDFEIR